MRRTKSRSCVASSWTGDFRSTTRAASARSVWSELYLDEVMRVLPYWSRERYIELAPKRWGAMRALLDAAELNAPVGVITVPGPTDTAMSPN